jgi:hypothetical protein
MKRISGRAVATAIASCFAILVQAQISPLPKWEFGLSAGPFIYQGDLAPSVAGSFKLVSAGGALSASRILNRSFSLRTGLTLAELRGDDRKYGHDRWRQARALRFRTTVFEVSEEIVYDIFGNNDRQLRWSPYIFAGIGYSFLKVRRDASRFDSTYFANNQGAAIISGLKADLAHDPPRGVLVVPVGVGVRYVITPAWSVNLEAAYRFSETDYLDGFSRVGNNGRNDHYYGITLGASFTLWPSKEMKCPSDKGMWKGTGTGF